MRLLHTADLHLGQVMYQYYDRVDEHDHYFGQLHRWCAEYGPDALLLCGDVFDMPQPTAQTKEHFNRAVAALHEAFPQMGIVIIAGNHDSAARMQADSVVWGLSGVALMGQAPPAHADNTDTDWADRYIIELKSGFVVALPFSPGNRREAAQALLDRVGQRNADGRPVAMCAHLAVEGIDFTGHGDIGNQRVVGLAEVGEGYDYLALGHIHRPQTVGRPLADEAEAESVYAAPVARYSGSALHVSCDERYPHTVSLVDIDRHGGEVSVRRLRIDELRHFHTLPSEAEPPAATADEAYAAVQQFCATHKGGYIRLRLDHAAPVPTGFIQHVYQMLEPYGGEVRFNPKTIWEGRPDDEAQSERRTFEVAELQQMADPLEFVLRTKDHYPELGEEQLRADFEEIERELRNMDEAAAIRTASRSKGKEATA